ncbi:hypothetical protein RB653_007265 [Dictyostelium firmibasis]|uniref:Ataxin-10 domain-containing protein n=1 Tax=Dictyostelium firmibasis TaxID=79012 RepID=A0AAN7YLX3_9MYCE
MDNSIYEYIIEENEAIERERNEQILEFERQEKLKLDLEIHLENNSNIKLLKDDMDFGENNNNNNDRNRNLLKNSSEIIIDNSKSSMPNEILRITNPILTEDERRHIKEINRINEIKAINYYHLLKISNAKLNNKKIIDNCLTKENNNKNEDTMISDITELFNLSKELEVRKEISIKHIEFLKILMNYIIKTTTNDDDEKIFKFNLTSIRLLRNLCANVSENQNIIISNSDFINFILNQLKNKSNGNIKQTQNIKNILSSLYQLLINGIVLNDTTQSLLWSNLYPNNLISLIENYKESDEFKLLPTNLMLIYNCILNSKDRMKDLISNKRLVELIVELIKEDDTFDHEYNTQIFHWIHLIFKSLFINDSFIDLYKLLSDNKYSTELVSSTTGKTEEKIEEEEDPTSKTTTTAATGKTNTNQVKLLNLLDSIIHDGEKKNIKDYIEKDSIIDLKTCYFMIDELASLYNLDFARKDLKVATQQLTSNLNQSDFDAIFFFIKIFANITSYTEEMLLLSLSIFKPNELPNDTKKNDEDPVNQILNDPFSKDSAIDPSASKKYDLNTLLRKKGLVGICIGSLHGNYGNQTTDTNNATSKSTTTEGETVTTKAFNIDVESQDKGFKIELIRILGNLSYKNRGNQDEIRELGGIEIILNHCRFDVNNPYIKEWSVFAIRNLCDDNLENQHLIENLKIKGVASNNELKDLGIEVGVTENGTIKFKNVPKKEKENK